MNNVLIKRGNIDTDIYTRRGLGLRFLRLAPRIWSGKSNRGCLTVERQIWKAWESGNCSVWEVGCLCSHCLSMKSWRTPAGLKFVSLRWNPDSVGFNTGRSNRTDGLANESEAGRQEAEPPPSLSS